MNEYLYEIMTETELTEEEQMYVNAHNRWKKNHKKRVENSRTESLYTFLHNYTECHSILPYKIMYEL